MLYMLGLPRWGSLRLPPTKPVCLLIFLSFRGDWLDREELAALFYPEDVEIDARKRLRVLLNRAKALPWAAGLEVENTRLRWSTPTDVQAFRNAIGRGEWAEAIRLHQAPFLEGFRVADVSGFEAWCEVERTSLLRAWQEAAMRESQELGLQREHRKAAHLLLHVLEQDPLAEDVLAAYMKQAYLSGQRDKALAAYQAFALYLRQELGLEPLENTSRLAEKITQATSLAQEAVPAQAAIPLSLLRPPRMVGREREQQLIGSHSQPMVLVAGEPGVGKTRLLQECFPQAVVIQCHEGLENLPFYPVVEYFKPRLAKLQSLGPYRDDVARLFPDMGTPTAAAQGDPLSAKLRLMEGLAVALEHEAQTLVFDDLQWADGSTLELLVLLATRGHRRVAGAYRISEVQSPLARTIAALRSTHKLLEIELGLLGLEQIQQLLADLIDQKEGPPLFARWLYKQSGGNPFFVLEVLRNLFERQTLRVEGGVWTTLLDTLTQDYSELEVPSQIGELVQRRIAPLRESTQRVLQTASVLQIEFNTDLLGQVAGLSEMAVAEAIEEAMQAGIVRGSSFVHDLIRQSFYASISQRRREILHRAWAKVLEGKTEPLVVAEHWWRAGMPQKAASMWQEAAHSYSQRGMYAEALGLLERVFPVEDRPELRMQQADALLCLGRYADCRSVLEPLVAQVRQSPLEPYVLSIWVHLLIREGHLQEARQNAQRLLQLTEGAPVSTRLRAVLAFANMAALMGQQEEALPLLEAQLSQMTGEPPSGTLASLYSNTGWLLCGLGRFEAALPMYHRALDTAKAANDRHLQVWASANLLYCCLELGQPEQALAEAEVCLRLGAFDGSEILRINLGKAYLDSGRLQEAIGMFEEVLHSSTDPSNCCVALGYLADLYAATDQNQKSREALQRALALVQETEMDRGRVRVLIAALKHGTQTQIAEVIPLLSQINRQAIPGYVWREFVEAQRTGQPG